MIKVGAGREGRTGPTDKTSMQIHHPSLADIVPCSIEHATIQQQIHEFQSSKGKGNQQLMFHTRATYRKERLQS